MFSSTGEVRVPRSRSQRSAVRRALLTGLKDPQSVAFARSLSRSGCRLVLHFQDDDATARALIADVQRDGQLIGSFSGALETAGQAMRLTADAAIAQGSLDLVVNFVALRAEQLKAAVSGDADFEDWLSPRLEAAMNGSFVAANRMGLTWREGLVVNVVTIDGGGRDEDRLIATLTRTVVAVCTRRLAETWESSGVRVVAIGPTVSSDDRPRRDFSRVLSEIADGQHGSLSGIVLDAELALAEA